jgi:hypothetical protein
MSPSDNEEKTNTRGEPTLRRSSSVFGSRTPRLQMTMPASIRKSTNVKTTQPTDSKSSDSSDATGVQRSMIAELTSLRSEIIELRERSARLEKTVATTPHTPTQTRPLTQTRIQDSEGYRGSDRAAFVKGYILSPVGREEFGRASLEYTQLGCMKPTARRVGVCPKTRI